MAGAELIGKEELHQIKRLFEKSNVNLYRYGQNNFLARELEDKFSGMLPPPGTAYLREMSLQPH